MAEGSPTPPHSRLRPVPLLLVGVGVLLLVLAVVVTLLVSNNSSDGKSTAAVSPSASPSSSANPTVNKIYSQVGPSVAVIQTAKGALGTGVVVTTSGSVLTANHVIADDSAITIVFADGTKSSATVASRNTATDTAVLTPATLPQPIVAATLGGTAAVGDPVIAIGNPLGLTYSVSSGVISGLNRTATTDNGHFAGMIQFDAATNPGSSGGPLLDAKGNVIGIVVSIAVPGAKPNGAGAFAGIAFAEPIGAALGGGGSGPPPSGGGPQI